MPASDDLIARLNGETARIAWAELQPHFARGNTVQVAPGLDLVAVAAAFVRDEAPRLRAWMAEGRVGPVDLARAEAWTRQRQVMWAVVVAPWVLVQPAGDA